jgi:hypothetical protein
VRLLEALGRDRLQLAPLAETASTLVRERHSWQQFVASLKAVTGYCIDQGSALLELEAAGVHE